ncbi:MAG: site-specific integrase [Pseudomonadota bacterium]
MKSDTAFDQQPKAHLNTLPATINDALIDDDRRERLWERWVTWRSARSTNTVRAVLFDISVFAGWARKNGHRPLPARPESVSLYLEEEASKGLAVATIERRASSISTLHRLAEERSPCDDELVSWRLSGIRRANGKSQRQAHPLRIKGDVEDIEHSSPNGLSLLSILAFLDDEIAGASKTTNVAERTRICRHAMRDAALFCVAYDAGLRASELVRVLNDHVTTAPGGGGELFLPLSKTDAEGEGSFRYLSERTLKRLSSWLGAAGIKEGPVFVGIKRSGMLNKSAIAPDTVGRIFKKRVEQYFRSRKDNPFLPLTPEEINIVKSISGHSGRIGVCQDAFAAGEDIGGIMRDFDWKSSRMPIRYARKLSARSGAASRLHKKTQ